MNTIEMQLPAKDRLLTAPVPRRTKTYTPIAHREVMNLTQETLYKQGFIVTGETYRANQEGTVGQGNYKISFGNDPDMTLMVAWQNSYNKEVSFKFCLGSVVLVCSNGMCIGDMGAYKTKHQGIADTEATNNIIEYIKGAGEHFDQLVYLKDSMKNIEVTKRQQAEIAGRWFIEEELITATQLGIIKGQIANPSYDYGTDQNTLWDIYNAATHSFKIKSRPDNWMKIHQDLSSWTCDEFGINQPEKSTFIISQPIQ